MQLISSNVSVVFNYWYSFFKIKIKHTIAVYQEEMSAPSAVFHPIICKLLSFDFLFSKQLLSH